MSEELRCQYKLHGIITEAGEFEVKCSSKFCGASSGIVVLHYFSLDNGKLLRTVTFSDPAKLFSTSKEE